MRQLRVSAHSRAVALGIMLLGCSAVILAQTNQGAITGNIVDESGAVVIGAKVTAVSQLTGVRQETNSVEGGFRLPSLPVGVYDLSVEHTGFGMVTQTGVVVQVGSTTSVNVTLHISATTQNVVVTAGAATVNQDTSDIGAVLNNRQIIELPLALGGVGALRSPEAFKFLAPGTVGPGTQNNSNGVWQAKTNGGQAFGDDVLLDGASTLRYENGSSFDEASPSVEAIQEFKVFTSTFSAQYDRTTGGILSFTMKSGTNQYHGTAYDLFQNTALNANTWFNSGYRARCAPSDSQCRATYDVPADRKNDFGLNLGGPVRIPKVYDGRNKSFFFFNWEQFRQTIGGTSVSTVPTAAARSGDFSQLLGKTQIGTNPCDGSAVFGQQIFDPQSQRIGPTGVPCRQAFYGNAIPASSISQVARNIMQYLPSPTSSAATRNFSLLDSSPLNNTVWNLRLDHSFTDSNRIFFSYNGRDNTRYTSGYRAYPAPVDSNGWDQDFLTHYYRAGWDYTFGPTLFNHFNAGFNRTVSANYTDSYLQAQAGNFDWDAKLGIKGASGFHFPVISVGEGITNMDRTNGNSSIDNGVRLNDFVMWIKGRHSLTFGVDVRRQLFSQVGQITQSGIFNFARAQTAANQALSSTSGNGFASFLLGAVSNANFVVQSHYARWLSGYYAGFLQDDFKITRSLTLNLGLRYNIDIPRTESFNDTSNFSPTTPNAGAGNRPGALIFGTQCHCNTAWADTYYKDISPRIGFAWAPVSLHNRTVLRGGYGLFYGPLQYIKGPQIMTQGYVASPTFFNSDSFTPGFYLDSGVPSYPAPPVLDPSYVNKGNPYYIAPDYGRPGMIQNWSFQVQHQLTADLLATAAYVGNRSTHLRSNLLNINNILPSYFTMGDALNATTGSAAAQQAGVTAPYPGFTGNVSQALRPFPQYGAITTSTIENMGQSSYEALQVSVQQRARAGLSLQIGFTWSKTLTDADSLDIPDYTGVSAAQNPYNLKQEKAISMQSLPLVFTGSWMYELPFGSGKKWLNHGGVLPAVLGGWQLGGVQRYQSGSPVSFGCATTIPGWDNCVRFNRVPGVGPYSAQVLNGTFDPFVNSYYSPAAFVDPNANRKGGAYQLGTYPRVAEFARMRPFYNEDFSVIKNIPLHFTESARLQFKAEILNAFNRHVFSAPDTNPYSPTFGLIIPSGQWGGSSGTVDQPRIVQFALRVNF